VGDHVFLQSDTAAVGETAHERHLKFATFEFCPDADLKIGAGDAWQ
jgi:hypothetical protein